MNHSELQALTGNISNDARVLYCLAIRPSANEITGITKELNYKHFSALLNSKETKYTRGRQLNNLIIELLQQGLVSFIEEVPQDKSFNKQKLLLPLLVLADDDYQNLHQSKQSMNVNWVPNDTLYQDLAQLVGIIEKDYYKEELGDFIAYWMGRPDALHTPFQWTHRFVQHIKKNRTKLGYKPVKQLATQTVNKKPELVADDNTRKLVEKYSGKHQR
ncbi:DnaT-like ssDNA-binding domain-containing protein [Alteromonas sp. a30]|uniref:DnaT-like ssDNA-binding domain-containing protein n=1 Tax=Alteromonas sp. a30 TaxID=2730917 RepID=UPI00228115EE|nr:DnaT-like ssDNA-binding domain-containing protein [Alteromonas sp. a30]MCY7295411.1 flavodoxin [Alteromonas sp. a30]